MTKTIVDDIVKMLDIAQGMNTQKSFSEPIPSQLDVLMNGIAQGIRSATPESLEIMTRSISDELAQAMLVLFPRRLCVYALRTGDVSKLENALILLGAEGQQYERRGSLATMIVIAYVARRIGAALPKLVSKVRRHLPSVSQRFFDEFLDRPTESNSLDTFAFREVTTPEGPNIVQDTT